MVETQSVFYEKFKKYCKTSFSNLKSQLNRFFENFMDYFFSKQTQMILNLGAGSDSPIR